MTGPGQVVVVGAGLAGLRTIEELRNRGYAGQVTLIGAERRLPYDRPPLSKKLMTGELDDTTLRHDLADLDVQALLDRSATGLPSARVLVTDDGPVEFDALVLATGATPVRLPGRGPPVRAAHPGRRPGTADAAAARHEAGHRRRRLDRR